MTVLGHVVWDVFACIGLLATACAVVLVALCFRKPKPYLDESYEVPPLRKVSVDEALRRDELEREDT